MQMGAASEMPLMRFSAEKATCAEASKHSRRMGSQRNMAPMIPTRMDGGQRAGRSGWQSVYLKIVVKLDG